MAITLTEIILKPKAYQSEIDKYGKKGLKQLWIDILERYAHEEWYDPDLVEEILKERKVGNYERP